MSEDGQLLGREEILNAEDKQYMEVRIPEWRGTVRLRGLSGRERDAYEETLFRQKGNDRRMNLRNARAKLAQRTIVGADGRQVFEEEDVLALGNKSAKALDRVFRLSMDLSGISDEDLERYVGNSDGDPGDGSTSA
jgi:hypothetical protein